MEQSFSQLKGDNPDKMDVCEEGETTFLQEIASVANLDQSMDSLKGSYNVPMFSMDQSNILQQSQGFSFSETSSQTSAHTNMFQGVRSDDMSKDIKPMPLFISADVPSLPQIISNNQTFDSSSVKNQNQSVFNTGTFVMSLQSNPGIISFGQPNNPSEVLSSDSVFTFGRENEQSQMNSGSTNSSNESASGVVHTENKASRGKHSGKHRQRKSRSQSTSNEAVQQKIEPNTSTSPTKLEALESQGSSEIGFKPSLLDEILTEKKMALMRSPEVMQFLQSQQKKITHGHYTES